MAFIPVPNTVQFNLHGLLWGEIWENTLYLTRGGAWTPAQMEAQCANLAGWWATSIAPQLANDISLTEVRAVDLTTQTSPTASFTVSPPAVGVINQDSLPGNVSLCVSFRTDFRGRSFRGRNYVGGISETNVTNNRVDQTVADALVAAYEELIAPSLIVGDTWAVVTRFHNGIPRTTGFATAITSVLVVDTVVDSMRRRLPGRGI